MKLPSVLRGLPPSPQPHLHVRYHPVKSPPPIPSPRSTDSILLRGSGAPLRCFPMRHWNPSTLLAEALTTHGDSGSRTRVLALSLSHPLSLPLTLRVHLSARLDFHEMSDLEQIMMERCVPQLHNFAPLIHFRCVSGEKIGVMEGSLSGGNTQLQDHGSLYYAPHRFLR